MSISIDLPYEFDGLEVEFSNPLSVARRSSIIELLEDALGGEWQIEKIFEDKYIYTFETDKRDIDSGAAFDTAVLLLQSDDITYASPNFEYGDIDPNWQFDEYDVQAQESSPDTIATSDFEWHLKQVKVKQAWAFSMEQGKAVKGAGVVIGQLDTGYTEHYEYLADANIESAKGYNFFEKTQSAVEPLNTINMGHGSATGSVLVSQEGPSQTNPSIAHVSGVSPASTLIPIRVDKNVWFLSPKRDVKGIKHALEQECQVISMSRSGLGRRSIEMVVEKAQRLGVIMVAAAGNCVPGCGIHSPAKYGSVVCAGGTTESAQPWEKSSRGPEVNICAPAHRVWRARTRNIDNDYNFDVEQSSGTSYATPIIAGAAALWIAHHGGHKKLAQKLGGIEKVPLAFQQLLNGPGATNPDGQWNTQDYGSGILNAVGLLKAPLPEITAEEADEFAMSSFSHRNPRRTALLESLAPGLSSKSQRLLDDEINFLLMTKSDFGVLHDQYINNEISIDLFAVQCDQLLVNHSSLHLRSIFQR